MPVPVLVKLMLYVYAFIAICSAIGFLHPKLRRPESRAIRQAINSWWPPALIGGMSVIFGWVIAVPTFVVVSTWALAEFMNLLPDEHRPRQVVIFAFLGVFLHYGGLLADRAELPSGALLAFWSLSAVPLAWMKHRGPEGLLSGVGRLMFGLLITVFALGHIAQLFLLPDRVGTHGPQGLAYLLFLSVMLNDASQYVVGKLFGRRRLAPVISPKKTWEGFAGGVFVTSLMTALVMPAVAPTSHLVGALVGAALAILGLLGDLLISAIKRDAGVKDTGAVLPGQGGILDRMDSFILSAPLYYHVVKAWLV